jgi:hypothetical protein
MRMLSLDVHAPLASYRFSLACRPFSKIFIVIDGFDELEEKAQEDLIQLSLEFFPTNSARLLISSRPHTPQLSFHLASAFCLKITGQATDIRKFVRSRFKKDYKLHMISAGDSSLAMSVAAEVSDRSHGQ